MTVQVALLFAVNLGAATKLLMRDLRAACLKAGCAEARTLLASGNVVLESKISGAALEKKLEDALAKETGLKAAIAVRSPAELAAAIKANPFKDFAKSAPSRLQLFFLKTKPSAAEVEKALAPQPGSEEIAIKGAHAYVTYPNGIGVSKFKLRVAGTGRNWNTVQKLAALAAEMKG